MSFEILPAAMALGGIIALAAILFALQRLRVRHRRVEVVTTLFWREAVEDARARVLVRRFRHPWAYALLVTICSLLWLALSGPGIPGDPAIEYVVLLDGSAGMTRAKRFDSAKAALRRSLEKLPEDRRRVIVCVADPRLLLDRGESVALLDARLDGIEPELAPSSLERALEELATSSAQARRVVALVFGDAPIREGVLARLPESFEIRRESLEETRPANSGITALGVAEARSGRADAVDVFVRVVHGARPAPASVPELALALGGQPLDITPRDVTRAGAEITAMTQELVFEDVPARSEILQVELTGGDALEVDNRASLVLPSREPIAVQVLGAIPGALAVALESDPGVELVDSDAELVIATPDTAAPAGMPSLTLVTATDDSDAFVIGADRATDDEAAREILERALRQLGLDRIDATALATSTGREITLAVEEDSERRIGVWDDLFANEYNFVDSSGFPLFVANALRWLARREPLIARVAAGSALPLEFIEDSRGRRLGAAGLEVTAPRAGEYSVADRSGTSRRLSVSLLDVGTTMLERVDVAPGGEVANLSRTRPIDLVGLLGLGGFALLLLEWWLLQRGRVP